MGKKVPDGNIDLMLDNVEGTQLHVCSDEPIDFADITNVVLAQGAISGVFTKADGDVSGRKTTMPAQSDVPISANGTATHVSVSDGVTLLNTTTCGAQALTSGGTVSVGAWAHEIQDSQ